ncbi:MAG: hypothetical protein E6472_10665, partial [Streptococcus salivarius]|nr:hypothetical protein [Streptococcus salivarius]
VISKLVLVLDIYSSLSLIWRYSYCLVFQGATSLSCLCIRMLAEWDEKRCYAYVTAIRELKYNLNEKRINLN